MESIPPRFELVLTIYDDIKSGDFVVKAKHQETIKAHDLVELASKFTLLMVRTTKEEMEIEIAKRLREEKNDDIPF